MDFRNTRPQNTYQNIVNTDGNFLYNSTGSRLDNLTILHLTASYVTESIISSSFIEAQEVDAVILSASVANLPVISATPNVVISGSNNNPVLYISGNPNIGGTVAQIGSSPAGMTISTTGATIFVSNNIAATSVTITAAGFLGTASYANEALSSANLDNFGSASFSFFDRPTINRPVLLYRENAANNNILGFGAGGGGNGLTMFAESASGDVSTLTTLFRVNNSSSAVFHVPLAIDSGSVTGSIQAQMFQLPYSASTSPLTISPVTGSTYVNVSQKLLYIYSGTAWMSSSLA